MVTCISVEGDAYTECGIVSAWVVPDGVLVDLDGGGSGQASVRTMPPHIIWSLTSLRRRGTQTVKVDVKPGDVIVSNWTGYVDILYLAFRYVLRSHPYAAVSSPPAALISRW